MVAVGAVAVGKDIGDALVAVTPVRSLPLTEARRLRHSQTQRRPPRHSWMQKSRCGVLGVQDCGGNPCQG